MNFLGLFICFFQLIVAIQLQILGDYGLCLPEKDRVNISRNIFEGIDSIFIESTRRSSHRIVSHIISILIRERLGYKTSIRDADWDNVTAAISRLACNKKSCESSKPESHINMEIWMPAGFTNSEWVNRDLIIDCGPLGPIAKTGIFYFNHENKNYPLDDWRRLQETTRQNFPKTYHDKSVFRHFMIFGNCNDSTSSLCRTQFAIDSKLPNRHAHVLNNLYKNWSIGSVLSDEFTKFYFTWYPNAITTQYKMSRILFPDCKYTDSNFPDSYCDDSINQLAKIVWFGIKTKAPLIYNLVDSFQLTQEDLVGFLKEVNISSGNIEQEYFKIACNWVLNYKAAWKPFTVGWNTTKELYIIILLPNTDSNISQDEKNALKSALRYLNNNFSYFGSRQYKVLVKYTNVTCEQSDIIQEYLKLVSPASEEEHHHEVGIISGLSTYCMNEIYKLTNAQRKIMVSFRHEIYPILARHGKNQILNISYIYQTMPSKEAYYFILEKLITTYDWKYVTIITDTDDYRSGLNASFIHKERVYQNKKIDKALFDQFLRQNIEKLSARIFLLDFNEADIFQILCTAGKLKMTLENGFVWIINRYFVNQSIINSFLWCKSEIESITSNYLYLSPYIKSAVECSDFYSNNLFRAVKFLGKMVYFALKKNPSFFEFNSDILMNYSRNVESREYFCSGKLISHSPIKMNENSFFWKVWSLYKINGSKTTTLFEFTLSEKFHILDTYEYKLKKIQSWNPPKDDSLNEDCWVGSLTKILHVNCVIAEMLVLMTISFFILLVFIFIILIFYKYKTRKIYYPMKTVFHELVQDLLDIDIDSSKLILNHIIGRGAFGMVYGGEALNAHGMLEAVAAKTISESSNWIEKIDFFTEAKVMRKLKHSNIVELIGVCLENENNLIFLIMELMVEGDLRNYLLSRRSKAAIYRENSLESIELRNRLNSFARDIAEGLNYMHSQFMVHRDIACRNCLISHDFHIKLGDFGLTRYLIPRCSTGIYKFQGNLSLPVRWMPPEGIQFGIFSIKSDIWSFGILLFELVTFGVCPYQDFSSNQNVDLIDRIKRNLLSIIDYLPQNAKDSVVHRLISQCCSYYSNNRPETMEQIIQILKSNNSCIRPYLTEDPPKFEGDKNLDNLSMNLPGIVIEDDEVTFTSPSEMHLDSSQKRINIINRAFGIKSVSVKEKTDFPVRQLRPCQSSVFISRNQLSEENIDSMRMKKPLDIFVSSIPTDLCYNTGFPKKPRTSTRSMSNFLKISPKTSNFKLKILSKDFQ